MSRKGMRYSAFDPADPPPLNMSTTELGFVSTLRNDAAAPRIAYVLNGGFRAYQPDMGIWTPQTQQQLCGILFAYAGDLHRRARDLAEKKSATAPRTEGATTALSEHNDRVLNYLGTTCKTESWARKTASVLASVLAHEQPMQESDFDSRANIVAFANCTIEIDYDTGGIRQHEHSPEFFLSRRCPRNFNPEASYAEWEAGLRRVYVHADGTPDTATITFLQRYFGHALSGKHDDRRSVFMGGHGCNGKTELLCALHKVFGDHQDDHGLAAWTTADKLICRTMYGNNSMYAARLVGARLAFADEVSDNRTIDEAAIKRLTGRLLEVEEKYKNPRGIRLRASLVIALNTLPTIKDTSEGMSSRLVCVPHNARFGKSDVVAMRKAAVQHDSFVADYAEWIVEREAEGIIAWCVQGMRDYLVEGNPASPAIVEATQAEIEDAKEGTPFGWFEDCALIEEGQTTRLSTAYESYCDYYRRQHGGRDRGMLSQRRFKRALMDMDVEVRKIRGEEGGAPKMRLVGIRIPPVLSTANFTP